eukprot:c12157_g1_i1 orf=426-1031(+)
MSLVTVRQRYSFSQVEVESQQQNQLVSPPVDTTFNYFNVYRALTSSSSHCEASWSRKLESCLWIASAVFIVYYGDFRTNLVVLLATDSRIHRLSFNLGLACFILNIAIFLYLAYQIHNADKSEDKLVILAPAGTIPAATIIGMIAFVLFSYALWPIWRFLTLPMLFTLFMALVVVAPYLAPYMDVRVDVDALRGLYVRPSE